MSYLWFPSLLLRDSTIFFESHSRKEIFLLLFFASRSWLDLEKGKHCGDSVTLFLTKKSEKYCSPIFNRLKILTTFSKWSHQFVSIFDNKCFYVLTIPIFLTVSVLPLLEEVLNNPQTFEQFFIQPVIHFCSMENSYTNLTLSRTFVSA